MSEIQKIGIIGAGQMGNGIAQVCAAAGFGVVLNDISAERIEKGISTITANLHKLAERKQLEDSAVKPILERIKPGPSPSAISSSRPLPKMSR
jgi:3-hydroxybutyryl-CoA dehydrogenase